MTESEITGSLSVYRYKEMIRARIERARFDPIEAENDHPEINRWNRYLDGLGVPQLQV